MPSATVMPPATSSVGFISVLQTIAVFAHVPTSCVGMTMVSTPSSIVRMPMTRMVSLRRAKNSRTPRAMSGTPVTISALADQKHFIMRYGTLVDSLADVLHAAHARVLDGARDAGLHVDGRRVVLAVLAVGELRHDDDHQPDDDDQDGKNLHRDPLPDVVGCDAPAPHRASDCMVAFFEPVQTQSVDARGESWGGRPARTPKRRG